MMSKEVPVKTKSTQTQLLGLELFQRSSLYSFRSTRTQLSGLSSDLCKQSFTYKRESLASVSLRCPWHWRVCALVYGMPSICLI